MINNMKQKKERLTKNKKALLIYMQKEKEQIEQQQLKNIQNEK